MQPAEYYHSISDGLLVGLSVDPTGPRPLLCRPRASVDPIYFERNMLHRAGNYKDMNVSWSPADGYIRSPAAKLTWLGK